MLQYNSKSVIGFPIAFGVFQEYYSSHPEKLGGDTANVAVIGTTISVRLILCDLECADCVRE